MCPNYISLKHNFLSSFKNNSYGGEIFICYIPQYEYEIKQTKKLNMDVFPTQNTMYCLLCQKGSMCVSALLCVSCQKNPKTNETNKMFPMGKHPCCIYKSIHHKMTSSCSHFPLLHRPLPLTCTQFSSYLN